MSDAITSPILIIAAIAMAALVAATVLAATTYAMDQLDVKTRREIDLMRADLTVVHHSGTEVGATNFTIFAKNIGSTSITIVETDIFLDGAYITLNGESTSLRWNVTWFGELSDQTWYPTRTIALNIFLAQGDSLTSGEHNIKVVCPGSEDSYDFSI